MTEAAAAEGYSLTPPSVDSDVKSPLAQFKGEHPPAPAWFKDALSQAPVERQIAVARTDIEVLEWGA